MALQKEIDNPFGSKAAYWRIAVINAHYVEKAVVVHLSGYINKECRDGNKEPIMTMALTFNFQNLEEGQEMPEVTRNFVYKHLKKQGELLDGAVDA